MDTIRELMRYVDRFGIPSKVGIDPAGGPYPDEDAVLVPIPSRLLVKIREGLEKVEE